MANLPVVDFRSQPCTEDESYFVFTTQNEVLISGHVGRPNHCAVYLAPICLLEFTIITFEGN